MIKKFIQDCTVGDLPLRKRAMSIYRNIFETSAVDINRKQIAAEPGTCTQGIVPNDNLAGTDKEPADPVISDLIGKSYASRFGQAKNVVNPGRTSLGMGETGPQNVNASCDSAGNA